MSATVERAKAALVEAQSIVDGAKAAGRPMTAAERRQAEELLAEANRLKDHEQLVRRIDEMNGALTPPSSTKSLAAAVAAERFHPVENPRVRVPASTLGLKAITLTGGAAAWDVFAAQPLELGYDDRFLASALKQRTVEFGTTAVQAVQETARTFAPAANMIRAVDAITAKPETATTMAVLNVPLNQVAHVLSDIPAVAFVGDGIREILESDMRLGVRDALDQLCFAALTAAGLPNNNFAAEPLLEKIRKAVSIVAAAGYAPDTLAVSPANMETLDLTKDTTNAYQFATTTPGSSAPLWGLRAVVSKRVTDTLVFDSTQFATLYSTGVEIAADTSTGFKTNTVVLRGEVYAACVRERASAGLRIGA